jgi:hypothetical protein
MAVQGYEGQSFIMSQTKSSRPQIGKMIRDWVVRW